MVKVDKLAACSYYTDNTAPVMVRATF